MYLGSGRMEDTRSTGHPSRPPPFARAAVMGMPRVSFPIFHINVKVIPLAMSALPAVDLRMVEEL
jgi:hypothetical protein